MMVKLYQKKKTVIIMGIRESRIWFGGELGNAV